MAQTLRQVLSDISTDVKALNIDDRLPFRFLASKFKDKIATILSQDARGREFVLETNIWKSINCVEFKDVNAIQCCGITDVNTIKKSLVKIPEAYSTNYGNLIKVFTLDGSKEYKQIKSFEYKDYTNREYGKPLCFWITDSHIYIPDSTLKAVQVSIIAKSPLEVDKLNGCNKCTSPLDEELNYPPKLITAAKQAVLQELTGVTKQIVQDEKPNDNQNEKS